MPGIPGQIDTADIKPWIMALVSGIVMTIVGALSGDIVVAVGHYVINALNSSGNLNVTTGFLDQVASVVGPVFSIVGVALIVIAASGIISILLETTRGT